MPIPLVLCRPHAPVDVSDCVRHRYPQKTFLIERPTFVTVTGFPDGGFNIHFAPLHSDDDAAPIRSGATDDLSLDTGDDAKE
jgi:hypothetical protein